ncbi:hypothetical protein E4J66_07025 [Actinomyces viscosus]|uniref:Uncharacterized protein n=1 Tax=Actinomyces viscosus TaxID=1656 RepID=A0A3S4Z2I5_ACTVI|nr:ABC-2 transporter permease [Actinomyces viscosus]TFH52675.1 hypothetical protein E4J66_07025 [Actinomyces viscosus]VEI16924.1 Uncharacterised protein [Actinomyces viscosus]
MSESMPMSVTSGRAVSTMPATAESSRGRAPGAPAAVRGTGALTRWEAVRAVMRLELLIAWRRRDTAALLVLCALGVLGVVVPGVRGWLGPFYLSPERLAYYLPVGASMAGPMLWLPSREARMRQLYGALPVTRLDILAARYLLLSVGWVIALLGSSAVALAVGGASNDAVGRHLAYLTCFGMIVAVTPPLLAAHGGTTSLPVLTLWGLAICFIVELPAAIGVQIALSAMPQQVVLAGGLGLITVLSAVGLGTSWRGCRRIYLRQDH